MPKDDARKLHSKKATTSNVTSTSATSELSATNIPNSVMLSALEGSEELLFSSPSFLRALQATGNESMNNLLAGRERTLDYEDESYEEESSIETSYANYFSESDTVSDTDYDTGFYADYDEDDSDEEESSSYSILTKNFINSLKPKFHSKRRKSEQANKQHLSNLVRSHKRFQFLTSDSADNVGDDDSFLSSSSEETEDSEKTENNSGVNNSSTSVKRGKTKNNRKSTSTSDLSSAHTQERNILGYSSRGRPIFSNQQSDHEYGDEMDKAISKVTGLTIKELNELDNEHGIFSNIRFAAFDAGKKTLTEIKDIEDELKKQNSSTIIIIADQSRDVNPAAISSSSDNSQGAKIKTIGDWLNEYQGNRKGFMEIWMNKNNRNILSSLIRYPGGLHEWMMVSMIPRFLQMGGIDMNWIKEFRDSTSMNYIGWHHGSDLSTTVHNLLRKAYMHAKSPAELVNNLNIVKQESGTVGGTNLDSLIDKIKEMDGKGIVWSDDSEDSKETSREDFAVIAKKHMEANRQKILDICLSMGRVPTTKRIAAEEEWMS